MSRLVEILKRHQLLAYFGLTYLMTWVIEFTVQPMYMGGQRWVAPLITLGIFAPALVSIGLSALIKPQPRQGSRKPAILVFFSVWTLASLVIIANLTLNQQMDLSPLLVSVGVITALLPAFVASSIFSTIPGVRDHLRTYIHPRGPFAYYLLALFLLPAIWLLGNLLSRALGMVTPFFRSPVVDLKLLASATIMFLYNVAYSSLSEEPGWRGFALPRLQAKFSPLVASLILGVLWSFWHVPFKFGGMDAASPADILVEWILILLVNIIFTWLFNRTQGSILVAALIHPAMNVMGSFLNASLGALVLLFGFIAFIIARDKMWRKLPVESLAVIQDSVGDLSPAAA